MKLNHSPCQLCGRITRRRPTEHHLIPRACHHNKWFKKRFTREEMQRTITVCPDCHSAIHRFVPKEKELGRYYHSTELLMGHEGLAGFVEWVKKQK